MQVAGRDFCALVFPNGACTIMHSHSRGAPTASPPSSAVHCRSFPHACALNYPLPFARLPTSANDPRHYSQVASEPGRRTTTRSHARSCRLPQATETHVRLSGVGVPYTS